MKIQRMGSYVLLVLLLLAFITVIGAILQYRYDRQMEASSHPHLFVETRMGRIHYEIQGEGDLTYVLVSGLGFGLQTWDSLARELSTSGRVFRFDRPGLGLSDAFPNPRNSQNIAEELGDFIRTLNLNGPIILVGHSMGASHIRYYAHIYPENVMGLVLLDPYIEGRAGGFPPLNTKQKALNFWLTNFSWSSSPRFLLAGSLRPEQLTTKHLRTYGQEKTGIYSSYNLLNKTSLDIARLPMLILWVKDADKRVRQENENYFKRMLDAQTNEIKMLKTYTGSHFIHETKTDQVALDIREFVSLIRKDDVLSDPPGTKNPPE